MDIKNNLSKIKELQKATAEVQAAANAVSRIKASARLIAILKGMGLYDPPADSVVDGADLDDGYSDNVNDDNYRYADTGYIAGSQKEKVGKRIKQLSKDGHTVKSTDIEWDEIEADELFAEDVIQKKNILGEIDYQAMKDADGDAGTAFIIQKVFASIAPQPHWDIVYFLKNSVRGKSMLRNTSQKNKIDILTALDNSDVSEQKRLARKAYVNGINTLKARINNKKDVQSLVNELKDISVEMVGSQVSAENIKAFEAANKALDDHWESIKQRSEKFEDEYRQAEIAALETLDMPKDSKKYGAAIPIYVRGKFEPYVGKSSFFVRRKSMLEWLKDKHPDIGFSDNINSRIAPVVTVKSLLKYSSLREDVELMMIEGKLAGFKDPNANLAWISLGERFWNIIELSSSSFVKHANMALNKKYDDWGLTIKEANTDTKGKSKSKTKSTFELVVADKLTRKGGREVNVNSTEELKDAFGFRDIQSGTWVLKDKAIAKFHVESAAAAMMDLSDIVGIDAKSLAFGGRLALALGARGRKGAAAHYEPRTRIINISKMKGGGSLGHEWFHAIDNILAEVMDVNGGTSAGLFLSKDSSILGDTPLNAAFGKLRSAMLEGDIRAPESFDITEKLIQVAKLNVPDSNLSRLQSIIKDNDATQAVIKIDEILANYKASTRNTWRKIAVAYNNQDKVGETITLNTGEQSSSFYVESKRLDEGRSKPYWSTTLEMAARAFQAFLEDSLKGQDRQNDYLSYGANNALYKNHNAYPEGAEREKINAVFAELFKVIKDERIFENASEDEAMMDAIFGAKSALFDDEQAALNALFGSSDHYW